MAYGKFGNDIRLVKILSLLTKGYSKNEISKTLNSSLYTTNKTLAIGRKEHNFKTDFQMIADYVKSEWWPEESSSRGTWQLNKETKIGISNGSMGR
jgi:hypothetical protein